MPLSLEWKNARAENDNEPVSSAPLPVPWLAQFANDACCFAEGVAVNPLTGGLPNSQRYFRDGAYAYLSRMIGNSAKLM